MSNIKLFESKQVRSVYNEQEEKWYFSIIDVIAVLTNSPRSRKYWNALKTKLQQEAPAIIIADLLKENEEHDKETE